MEGIIVSASSASPVNIVLRWSETRTHRQRHLLESSYMSSLGVEWKRKRKSKLMRTNDSITELT
jgi:hypothetical protein